MALIQFQPEPEIPPIGFFDPISVDPKDMMTDVEYLLGILKKLNEVIAQVNSNTQFINEYSGKIEEIEAEVASIRNEMIEFENDVNENINARFNAISLELRSMIATALDQANAYTDLVAQGLENEIQNIAVGQITLYDPTTGTMNSLQNVIENLYGTTREDALTATEYDALELTATDYDTLEITATDYDRYGKLYLITSA